MKTSVEKQIEAIRADFAASDKGTGARKDAWLRIAEVVKCINVSDEDAALPLLRFVKNDLCSAGPWPTEALPTLICLEPLTARWIDVIDAENDVASALRRHAAALEKVRTCEKEHARLA